MTLGDDYCRQIRPMRVSAIGTEDVLKVLKPIWLTKTVTASRLSGRIESVLSFAKTRGWRSGENPAAWRGHLDQLLSAPRKLRRMKHHAAMPYDRLPAFMERLRGEDAMSALALEFLILTVSRMSEAARGSLGRGRPRRGRLDGAGRTHEGGPRPSGAAVQQGARHP